MAVRPNLPLAAAAKVVAAACLLLLIAQLPCLRPSSAPNSVALLGSRPAAAAMAPLLAQLPGWWWASHLQGSPQRCGGNSCMQQADLAVVAAIDAAAASGAAAPAQPAEGGGSLAQREPMFSGMRGEDRYLWQHLFYGRANGTYLEMGAVDGVKLSNSRFFAQHLGWVGVLVEALPDQLPALVQNRPESVCVNTAVCGDFSSVHYWRHQHSPLVSGIKEFMSPAFLDRWYPPLPNGSRSNLREERAVPCLPLSYLLDCLRLRQFDLWSLDVEGAELEVLRTVDFDRTRFGAILVELDGKSPAKDASVVALLARHGYRVHWRDSQNTVFVGLGFVPSAKPDA